MLKLLSESKKRSNMLLHQKSPLCNIELGGDHHQGEFNKPLIFIKTSTSTQEDVAQKKEVPKSKVKAGKERASTSKATPTKDASTYHYCGRHGHY